MKNKQILFFQHFHNGDLFATKEYIRQINDYMKTVSPTVNVGYLHNNHPKTLLDLNINVIGKPDKHYHFLFRRPKSSPWYIDEGDTLFVNTWVEGFFRQYPSIIVDEPHGINPHKMNILWNHIYNKINNKFGTTLSVASPENYVCSTDYSIFDISSIDNHIRSNPEEKRILICNGEVKSNQSFGGTMQDILGILAKEYPDWNFYCTTKFETLIPNIRFTDDIIPQGNTWNIDDKIPDWSKHVCDLNEISYFSKFCNIVVGRNSGPFVYCITKENMSDSNKTLISFNTFKTDSLVYNLKHNAKYVWSNNFEINSVLNIIREELNFRN